MGKKRTIKKQSGYPTSDGLMHDKYKDAVTHQASLDFTAACSKSQPSIELKDMRDFVTNNAEVISDYIKYCPAGFVEGGKKASNKEPEKPAAAKKDKA